MLTYILFFVGLVILVKGADLLVDGASSLARRMRVSDISIGLTIVAFGTSMPEMVVSVLASIKGNTDIAIGNVLGSNIFNILLILGLSALLCPLVTQRNTVWKEIPLSLLAAVIVGITANDQWIDGAASSELNRIDGLVYLAFFIIFLYYTYGISQVTGDAASMASSGARSHSVGRSVLFVFLGLAGLVFGGKWIVEGAVQFARVLGVSESLIGLTIVAAGTSLPELATSLVAARKGQMDIAIGNVVGSNIFNIFFILGTSAVLAPLPFAPASQLDILMTIFASLLLFMLMFVGKRHTVERWQGGLMLLFYVGYVGFLVSRQMAG
ncbi:MAG: calcium/sodium antiporter [Saprospiraceae bacterium]|nr:calcium/sodium antiporter [Saprospiraceae bacterium]